MTTLLRRTMRVCDGCYRLVPARMLRPVEGTLALCPDCRALYTLDALLPARLRSA